MLRAECGEEPIPGFGTPSELARMFYDAILLDRQVRIARIGWCIRDGIDRSEAGIFDELNQILQCGFHFSYYRLFFWVVKARITRIAKIIISIFQCFL